MEMPIKRRALCLFCTAAPRARSWKYLNFLENRWCGHGRFFSDKQLGRHSSPVMQGTKKMEEKFVLAGSEFWQSGTCHNWDRKAHLWELSKLVVTWNQSSVNLSTELIKTGMFLPSLQALCPSAPQRPASVFLSGKVRYGHSPKFSEQLCTQTASLPTIFKTSILSRAWHFHHHQLMHLQPGTAL